MPVVTADKQKLIIMLNHSISIWVNYSLSTVGIPDTLELLSNYLVETVNSADLASAEEKQLLLDATIGLIQQINKELSGKDNGTLQEVVKKRNPNADEMN